MNIVEQFPVVKFECVRYRVGSREFKTAWWAWRHVAKMELLQEIEDEARGVLRLLGVHYPDSETLKFERDRIFKSRYLAPLHYGDPSEFSIAVAARARQLRDMKR